MTLVVFYKLLAIFITAGLGYAAARLRWLGEISPASARLLGNLAFVIFVPALLFRTMARLDLAHMPWRVVAAYFVPTVAMLLVVYAAQRRHAARDGAAGPATRATTALYGNAVQLGIPVAAALFGEAGLAIHVALVSLHAVIVLTLLTLLAEVDLAREHAARHGAASIGAVMKTTLRNALIHPVVLPVLAGLAWNLTGWGLHPVLDEVLRQMGSAVVPLTLVLIGITLSAYGIAGHLRGALAPSVFKLAVLPAVVLPAAHWGFGLDGVPLAVVVMMAALPVGNNALIFAQRYEVLEGQATAAITISTLAYVVTASAWLGVLAALAAPA